ncbi:MAG: Fe-S oxidoreductase [Deltaproteobacteria bacterium]|nr:MAG: Fe-S oxidoreductase [Deltaproteobacteria bacterium]
MDRTQGHLPILEEGSSFSFACHQDVSCFTLCCKNVNLTLYPYDIIRLKNRLKIDSESFVRRFCFLERADNPYFPSLKLRLDEDREKACPFLAETGCTVYSDRPSACRTYPLERGALGDERGCRQDRYFLTRHPYCKGHFEDRQQRVDLWLRSQQLHDYNTMNDLWAEMDVFFATNPWQGEGVGGEKQQLAFMVCYNIDTFREFCRRHTLLGQFRLDRDVKKRIRQEDSELLKFGFEWLKLLFGGQSSLVR